MDAGKGFVQAGKQAHGVNANQVFGWRQLYLTGKLGEQNPGVKLLLVRVRENLAAPVVLDQVRRILPEYRQE